MFTRVNSQIEIHVIILDFLWTLILATTKRNAEKYGTKRRTGGRERERMRIFGEIILFVILDLVMYKHILLLVVLDHHAMMLSIWAFQLF